MSAYGASDADRKRAQRLRTVRTRHERGHGPALRATDAKWLARYESTRLSHVRAVPELEREDAPAPAPARPALRVVPPPTEEMDRVSFDEPPPAPPSPAAPGAELDDDDEDDDDGVPVVEGEPVEEPSSRPHVETCGNENCYHCRKRKGLGARVESICPVTKGEIWKPLSDSAATALATGMFLVVGLIACLVAKLMGHPNPKLIEPTPLEHESLVKYIKEVTRNRAPWVAMFDDFLGLFGTVGIYARRAYSEGKGPPKLASVTPIREGAAGAAPT